MINFSLGVYLGPLDSAHNDKIRAWRNNPAIYSWCRQIGLISDVDQRRWFEKQSLDPSIRMYGVFDAGKDKLVGVCGFTSIDHVNRRAEFSLYIGKEMQGNRYGENALKTLFRHGFNDLNLNLIWGETFDGNPASRMFEKIGMVLEGTRRDFYFKSGKFIDAHLYSIRRSEWVF